METTKVIPRSVAGALDKHLRLAYAIEAKEKAVVAFLEAVGGRLPQMCVRSATLWLAKAAKERRRLVQYSLFHSTELPIVYSQVRAWFREFDLPKDEFLVYVVGQEAAPHIGHHSYGQDKFAPYKKVFYDRMAEQAERARVGTLQWRIAQEFLYAERNDWHPYFVTLTVSSEHYVEVFRKGSLVWNNFIRKLRNRCEAYVYGSRRKAAGKPSVFEYFAVVEEGSKTGRLHIHLVFWTPAVIHDMSDPNAGRHIPNYVEIRELRSLWEYGISAWQPARTHSQDIWARKYGWRWPVRKNSRTGEWEPMKASGIMGCAKYVVKYITKSKHQQSEDIRQWRSRLSRGMGMRCLQEEVERLSMEEVRQLLIMQNVPLRLMEVRTTLGTVPQSLVRKELVRRALNLSPVTVRANLVRETSISILREQCAFLIQEKPDHSSLNIGLSAVRSLIRTGIFEDARVLTLRFRRRLAKALSIDDARVFNTTPSGVVIHARC